jgi:hypothetical protein
LIDDIGETHDLMPTHPDLVSELHTLLMNWRKQIEAKLPQLNPAPTL